jgi:hypothetical protein
VRHTVVRSLPVQAPANESLSGSRSALRRGNFPPRRGKKNRRPWFLDSKIFGKFTDLWTAVQAAVSSSPVQLDLLTTVSHAPRAGAVGTRRRIHRLVHSFALAAVDNPNTRRAYKAHLLRAFETVSILDISSPTVRHLAAFRAAVMSSTLSTFYCRGLLERSGPRLHSKFRSQLLAARARVLPRPMLLHHGLIKIGIAQAEYVRSPGVSPEHYAVSTHLSGRSPAVYVLSARLLRTVARSLKYLSTLSYK